MIAKISTSSPTETDLEVRLSELLKQALPGLAGKGIHHQCSFSIKFGHNTIKKGPSVHTARSDILLTRDGKNFAIIELKRESLDLNEDDDRQGLSYARVLHPRPPIVIISNGLETRVLETATGTPIEPSSLTEETFIKLISNAALMAKKDVSEAISSLMATDPAFWTPAFKLASQRVLLEKTMMPGQSEAPFIDGLLIPREATNAIITAFQSNESLVIVEGAPLTGKSHVLKDFHERHIKSEELLVFYISADHGGNIFEDIGDALAEALSTPVTPAKAREWLKNASASNGPYLVLAIDDLSIYKPEWVRQIRDLTSSKFGDKLKVILAIDDELSNRILTSETGRRSSVLSKRAKRVTVGHLSNQEFRQANEVLKRLKAHFVLGAHFSSAYRLPWVMGRIMRNISQSPNANNPNMMAVVPAILGTNLIMEAENQEHSIEVLSAMHDVAKAMLQEVLDDNRDHVLKLESTNTFIIRRDMFRNSVNTEDKNTLIAGGYIRLLQGSDGDSVYLVKTPEFLASEVSKLLSKTIINSRKQEDLGAYLVRVSKNLPMGDIIAGHALFLANQTLKGIPIQLVTYLMREEPTSEKLNPGTTMLMQMPNGQPLELIYDANGTLSVDIDGELHSIDDEEVGVLYDSFDPWLILAHLCHHRMEALNSNGESMDVDGGILLQIGKARMPIRRPQSNFELNELPVHEIGGHGVIVCHKAGIVEPVTQAIFILLKRDIKRAEHWIDAAITENSFPLLARIHLALTVLQGTSAGEDEEFFDRMLKQKILPAMEIFPKLH